MIIFTFDRLSPIFSYCEYTGHLKEVVNDKKTQAYSGMNDIEMTFYKIVLHIWVS